MPLFLTAETSSVPDHDVWCAVGDASGLDIARQLPSLAQKLEAAFDAAKEDWWELGRQLGQNPTAIMAHAPACATNATDFGLMLAWSRLAREWIDGSEKVLLICQDPWLFRHIASQAKVQIVSPPPPLLWRELCLRARGIMARVWASWRFALAALSLSRQPQPVSGAPSLLVYAHPRSTADGMDAYFGSLLQRYPDLLRVLHIDATASRVSALMGNGRTFGLHAFGSVFFALMLWRARWRAKPFGPNAWLIRRALILEGSTAQAAAIRWQIHCQDQWIRKIRPRVVLWPWENHAWERALIRTCHAMGIKTIGYQHATVGWREWNYSPRSNPDGDNSLPQQIFCVGKQDTLRLASYGWDIGRLTVAGALRFSNEVKTRYDPQAPIFVALPFDAAIADEMIAAIRPLAQRGRQFLVKDHPMSPFQFTEAPGLKRSVAPLDALEAVSAVLYCITTVGLEALLAGLPVLRFLPAGRVAVDVAPEGVKVPTAASLDLEVALSTLRQTPAPDRTNVFAAPEDDIWKAAIVAQSR